MTGWFENGPSQIRTGKEALREAGTLQMNERRSSLVRLVAALGSMSVGTVLLLGALPGSASADDAPTSPSTSVVEGENPTCADLGDFAHEFKIDNIDEVPEEGVYSDPNSDFEVEITDVGGDPLTFSFTANIAVSAVFVKAGDGGILYTFDPPSTTGTALASPKDSISHISFCWNGKVTTTSESTTSSSTSSTTEKDHTTTTKVEETTTTVKEGTTTTLGEEETTTTVAGTATTAPSPEGELPKTGNTTWPLVAVGAVLLSGGFGLLLATRLRKS